MASRDLENDRTACTADCNAAGHCCTTDTGGCAQLMCSAGCLLAWHDDSEAECETANQAGCSSRTPSARDANIFLT